MVPFQPAKKGPLLSRRYPDGNVSGITAQCVSVVPQGAVMAMRIHCPNPECGKRYKASDSLLGRQLTCKHCGQVFTVRPGAGATGTSPAVETAEPPAGKSSEPNALQKLGRFEIRSRIGSGTFGTVYRAYDPVLDNHLSSEQTNLFAGNCCFPAQRSTTGAALRELVGLR